MAQQRTPPGVPSGGQFSASAHDEPATELGDGNPGCDSCGQADAVVFIKGRGYCADCAPHRAVGADTENPGCDDCGQEDAEVTVEGRQLCGGCAEAAQAAESTRRSRSSLEVESVLVPTTHDLSLSRGKRRLAEVGERVSYEVPMSDHVTGTVVGTSDGYAGLVDQVVVLDDGRAIVAAIGVSDMAGWQIEEPRFRRAPVRFRNGFDGVDINVTQAGEMNPGYVVMGVGDTDNEPFLVREIHPVGRTQEGRTAAWRYHGEPLDPSGDGPRALLVGADAQLRLLTRMPNGGRERWDGTGDQDDWRTRVQRHLDARPAKET